MNIQLSILQKLKVKHKLRATRWLLLAAFVLLAPAWADAQTTITGTVKDAGSSDALIGATVMEQGSTTGTITDLNGAFSLEVSDDATTLVISSVGYGSQNASIAGRSVIDIMLSQSASLLDEVVVTGYGTARQREVTSAITSVSSEEFNKGNVNDPMALLQGKVAGLAVARAGSDVNQPFYINIRGVSTLGANSQPLIVIDGMIGASLNNVDPNDIEKVDVLKDASAAAIYGTRGSAGVIIITTKKGTGTSEPQFDYNAQYVYDQPLLNGYGGNVRLANGQEFIGAGGIDYGAETDWVDEITDPGKSHVHNFSYSHGSDATSVRASLNYRDIDGVLREQALKQINGRINFQQKLANDRLTLTSLVSFTRRNQVFSNRDAIHRAYQFPPTAPVYNNNDPSQGFFENFVEQNYNPVAMIDLIPSEGRTREFLGNFKLDYEVIEGLNVGVNYGIRGENELQAGYINSQARAALRVVGGEAQRVARDLEDQIFEATASYRASSGDLTYTILGGYGFQDTDADIFRVVNSDFITDDLSFNNLGLGNGFSDPTGTRVAQSNREGRELASYFGRVNLGFKDAYHFMASYRREGSSTFGANNRWGNFWAIGGSVNFTELADLGGINDLKLRAGYGLTGNLPFQNFAFLNTLGPVGQGYVGGAFVPSIQPTSNPNPDLKWEEKGEFNVGLDFAVMDYKLSGSIDYFKRNTTDLLNVISVPSPPNLFGTSLVNLGELETNGFEVQLNYSVVNNQDFSWEIGANVARNITSLVKFNNDDNVVLFRGLNFGENTTFAVRIEEGERIGQIIAPLHMGYDENGISLFLQEDGSVSPARVAPTAQPVIGNAQPDAMVGLTNSISWKNFDLNIFMRGVFGHDLGNEHRAGYEHPASTGFQNFLVTDKYNQQESESFTWNSTYVEDATFVTLDNMTLGYTFDTPESTGIRNLRFYASVQRLFTITNYAAWDPEPRYFDVGTSGGTNRVPFGQSFEVADGSFGTNGTNTGSNYTWQGDILAPGLDRNERVVVPRRTWTFGLNIGF